MSRPNILYLHSHDTGRYIQPYGYAVPTPNLQKLAAEGVLFRQAFCAAPTCSPSRAALLTGQSAHSSGMLGLAHRGFALNHCEEHLARVLSRAGYLSVLAGVQHLGAAPSIYDRRLEPENHTAACVAPAAVEFLRRTPEQPFFLDVGFSETHREFPRPGPAADPRYCRPPAPLPDTPQTRADMAAFTAMARRLDQGAGAVLEALEEKGLAGNTLVLCTTDHGIAFPGMKCNLSDHGMGVLLIARGPGGFAGGRVCEALVSHLDLFPTLCELLRIEEPAWLQGRSMLPLLRGEVEQINEAVFAEVSYHAAYEPQRALRTRRWKYIRRFAPRSLPVLPNCDDGPSKELWLEHGWKTRPVAAEQLYDLIFDPNEANNLAAAPACGARLEEMRQRLERWMRETEDPLLRGPVPAPRGARVNDAEGLSPREAPEER